MHKRTNSMTIILNIISIIILVGGTAISYYIATPLDGEFIVQLFIVPIFITFLSAMVLFAIAEIIQLLQDSKYIKIDILDKLEDIESYILKQTKNSHD